MGIKSAVGEQAASLRQAIQQNGFQVLPSFLEEDSLQAITACIEEYTSHSQQQHNSAGVFAIRSLLKKIPELTNLLMGTPLRDFVTTCFGPEYFLVKSIYFNKPELANWFVAYHQDLTIAVKEKQELPGFGAWTHKPEYFSVQAPVSLLEHHFTLRLHLDDADAGNGALKVIPGSHLQGVVQPGSTHWEQAAVTVNVPRGGAMIMKPLLVHGSSRVVSARSRRVIHLEFAHQPLPAPLQWAESLSW